MMEVLTLSDQIFLESAINNRIDEFINNLNFSMPAKITNIDKINDGVVNVQPIISKLTPDFMDLPYPEIKNVPLVVYTNNNISILPPISIGDEVLLEFSQHSIFEYKNGNSELHDAFCNDGLQLQNAIAKIGMSNKNTTPYNLNNYRNEININDLNIVMNKGQPNECLFILKQDGSTELKSSKLVSNTEVIETDGDIIIQGMSLYKFMTSHIHNYTDDGTPMQTSPPVMQG